MFILRYETGLNLYNIVNHSTTKKDNINDKPMLVLHIVQLIIFNFINRFWIMQIK